MICWKKLIALGANEGSKMRGVILGHKGSIGKRHWNNIKKLYPKIELVGIDECCDCCKDANVRYQLNEGVVWLRKKQFDFGIVCTPTSEHLKHCIMLAEREIPFFCEKPLYAPDWKSSEPLKELENLFDLVGSFKMFPNMVACNWRFHPEIVKLPSDAKFLKVRFGYRLDKWKPDTNHLESYSANRSLGGGILLDCIHEFDYLRWKFGAIKDIKLNAFRFNKGEQTVDTEDVVFGHIEFESGTIAEIHVDYLSEFYNRSFEYFCEGGTEKVPIYPDNQMYVDELRHFLGYVGANQQPMNDIFEAADLVDSLVENTKWRF